MPLFSDVIKLEEGIGDKVSAFVYSLTTAIGCIVMAMLKGWKLALLCLTTTPVTFLLVGLTGRVRDINIADQLHCYYHCNPFRVKAPFMISRRGPVPRYDRDCRYSLVEW